MKSSDSIFQIISLAEGLLSNSTNYSTVNINGNGGLGEVISKNNNLINLDLMDGLSAVKHGNGRDWWIITHAWNNLNTFYEYLVTPYGFNGPYIYSVGSNVNTDVGNIRFSNKGSKLLLTNVFGLIEVLDFNRCNGQISDPSIIMSEKIISPPLLFGSSISPNGHFIYVSNTDNIFGDSLRLGQYDLTAPNIAASKTNIYTAQVPASGGQHALAPEGKIYIACLYEEGFPYSDTTHNIYTDNLSVINYPDSPGVACVFQPFSFYLGGNRCYWGLPNNPNYVLGRDSGSVCDTLLWAGIGEIYSMDQTINVYPNPVNAVLNVSLNNRLPADALITISDMQGRVVKKETISQNNSSIIQIDISALSLGVYFLRVDGVVKRWFVKL